VLETTLMTHHGSLCRLFAHEIRRALPAAAVSGRVIRGASGQFFRILLEFDFPQGPNARHTLSARGCSYAALAQCNLGHLTKIAGAQTEKVDRTATEEIFDRPARLGNINAAQRCLAIEYESRRRNSRR
jgi:hypothetical protein